MSSRDENVVDFRPGKEIGDAEKAQRVMAEATRLASLAPGEWRVWIDGSAQRLDIPRATLEALVTDIIKDREKQAREKVAEDRRVEQRAEKSRNEEDRKKEREQGEKRKAEKEAEREKRKAEKEAERKAKEKAKIFGDIMRLPAARHEKELQRLAERLEEDAAALCEEFAEFLGIGAEMSFEKTEPWPEPVDTATLLQECGRKISRYIVLREHLLTASVLWSAHCWLYDHNVPTHSPMLALTSAEIDSGKSTLAVVVGYTTLFARTYLKIV